MISSNWPELLYPGLRKIYSKQIGHLKDYLPTVYNVESSSKASEFNLGTGSMGTMDDWETTGNTVSYEDIAKGFKSTYTHKKYSKGVRVERELLDDDQYSEIKKRVRSLAQSVWYTRQVHAAALFNGAFTGVGTNGKSLLGPDGLALCHGTHPVAPNATASFSNRNTRPLTADNLEATRNDMLTWKDDKGNLLPITPDTLIVPPTLRKAALVIADSPGEPSTMNNDVNIWKGSVDVIEWPFLTGKGWFLVDRNRMKQFLNWYDRRTPNLEADDADFNGESAAWKVVGRWSFGWDDPTFIFGNIPA